MAGHATNQIDAATLWGGKISPFSTSYGKLMMWFFLVSDALTFGGYWLLMDTHVTIVKMHGRSVKKRSIQCHSSVMVTLCFMLP